MKPAVRGAVTVACRVGWLPADLPARAIIERVIPGPQYWSGPRCSRDIAVPREFDDPSDSSSTSADVVLDLVSA